MHLTKQIKAGKALESGEYYHYLLPIRKISNRMADDNCAFFLDPLPICHSYCGLGSS
jgi:hypothetical protein